MPPVLSKFGEHNNYLRFCFAVLNIGTKCVRKEFDKEFHPSKLTEVLKNKRYTLERKLDKDQQKLVYQSPPNQVRSQLFDMSLMICILKHIAKLDIANIFPVKSNIKETDDLSRLKWYRNICCHPSETIIDNDTFETYSNELLQVVERLGDPGWKEECIRILTGSIDALVNENKFTLLQLFTNLHSKGYNTNNIVSEEFWYFTVSQQLEFLLSLMEFHFWIYPHISILWNEFQDSYNENPDTNFFAKPECQPDTQDVEGTGCYLRSSAVKYKRALKGLHIIEIECTNCPDIIKKDEKVNEAQHPNNIIRMVCTCTQGLLAGEICYMTLFTMLDPRRYKHSNSPTNDIPYDAHFICSMKESIYKSDNTKNVKGKRKLLTNRETLSCTPTKQASTDIEQRELRHQPMNTCIPFLPHGFQAFGGLIH